MYQSIRYFIATILLLTTFTAGAKSTSLPIEQVNRFTYFLEQIRTAYVEPVDDGELIEFAIQGMLDGLDPHSEYLDSDEIQDLRETTEGNYGGVGIELAMNDGKLTIISALDNTPASAAGLTSGDIITAINGTSFRGMRFAQALKLLRGEIGTALTLDIYRESIDKSFSVSLVRDEIVIQSVRYEQLSDSIGYIQIRQFQSDTTQDVMDALDALLLNDLTGLVLDLRDNPGGTLSSAIGVSDLFLSDNTIVSTRGRLEAMNQEIKATPNEYFANKPIVVLINGGSASASEIVAGALQDTKRAIVMGVKSFGKGSVQSILEHDNVAIKLTTARYYTPSGHSIQGLGITPDIEVAVTQISGSQAKQLFSERSLYGALKGEDKAPDKHSTPPSSLAESDYQLYEAVNLLVALNLYAKLNQ